MPHNFASRKANNKAGSNSDSRLPGRPRPRFVFAHHPDSWEFVNGEWLPRLKSIPLVPGVNGCRPGPNGHLQVIARLQSDRFTVLDEDMEIRVTDPETGEIVTDSGYMVEWEGQKGAHYSDAWCSPMLYGAGNRLQIDWSTEYDRAGFDAWRSWLVESGAIKRPTTAAMARLIKIQEKRANRRIGESHDGNPHVQAHVKREQDKLSDMKKAAPQPKKRRARAAKRKISNQRATDNA